MRNTKLRIVLANGILAAMYLVLTIMVSPVSQGAVQFRISEALNHVVVFNRKLIWGVFGGVFIYNLLYAEAGWLDVVFGSGQTLIALGLTALFCKYVKNTWARMVFNIFIFTISMFSIAWMLHIAFQLPFWATYASTALSEAIIMTLSAPIMYVVGKSVKFKLE